MKKNFKNGIGLIEAVAGISIISVFIFQPNPHKRPQLSQKIVGRGSVRNIQASFYWREGSGCR